MAKQANNAPQNSPADTQQEKPAMTKAQAAAAIKRRVPVLDDDGSPKLNDDGEQVVKHVALKEDEVMNFAVYDDGVVVVTTSGEKLAGPLPSK